MQAMAAIEPAPGRRACRAWPASLLALSRVALPALLSVTVSPAFAAVDAAAIRPVAGLVITSTEHSNTVAAQSRGVQSYNDLDKEEWTSVQTNAPDFITYKIQLSAPANQQADADMKRFKLIRKVRQEDLKESNRMTLLLGSDDSETYAGQTFAETSAKTLALLKSGTEVPFVLGVRDYTAGILDAAVAESAKKAPQSQGPVSAGDLSNAFFLMNSGRDYYRGKLHRVEPGLVTLPVLVNGERTTLPAVHAAGTFTVGSKPPQQAEFWWLDNPAYPLMLKWNFAAANSLVTKIDFPRDSDGGGGSGTGSTASNMAEQLDKSCRVQLWGIYFNTGSAQLLEESQPTLKTVAAVIKQSKDAVLTVEGHTDNIGTADYNQDLSERRAGAVRQALVAQFGVPANRLTAKGYGLKRPVETNATVEGRARNRRVELTRPCAAGR
jgi:outer membrane protein OmpA-like peptidoglycan-associated protein